MPFGVGQKTIMTSLITFAIATVFFALVARFTGFDLKAIAGG